MTMTYRPMCIIMALAAMVSTSNIYAQSSPSIDFSVRYTPETTYAMSNVTINTMSMTSTGTTSEAKKRLGANNGKTVTTTSTKEMTGKIIIGKRGSDQQCPLEFNIEKIAARQGATTPSAANILQDIRMTGKYTANDKIVLDSVMSTSLPANARTMMLNMMNTVLAQVQVPGKTLSIGDSVVQNNTLNMPIGATTMTVAMQISYTLRRVEGKLAYLDIHTNAKFSYEGGAVDGLKATGGGNGKMVYNVDTHYPENADNELNIGIDRMQDKVKTHLKVTVHSLQKVTVTH
ncbi:hypothetical protein LLH06_06365 [Mucilaginibacter daejeonensis]|uniref:hypothetical protein n=1 Tax=Mucilaginibacter daejeonensis TaxID=398049 RepID=UPI001D178784|nr:hypothetical protein [Mucilaginibacter daejeonensis]UEG54583.1 hypothetical protein LLH06_06365 [Mucilaginibacter daejeonensis]